MKRKRLFVYTDAFISGFRIHSVNSSCSTYKTDVFTCTFLMHIRATQPIPERLSFIKVFGGHEFHNAFLLFVFKGYSKTMTCWKNKNTKVCLSPDQPDKPFSPFSALGCLSMFEVIIFFSGTLLLYIFFINYAHLQRSLDNCMQISYNNCTQVYLKTKCLVTTIGRTRLYTNEMH